MNKQIKEELGDYIEYEQKIEIENLPKRSRPDPMANAMVYTIWNTKVGVSKNLS